MSDDTLRLYAARGARDFPPDSDQVNGGAPGIVGRITTATGTIGVDKFFMLQPQTLTGGECEGCTGTFTDLPTASIPVYNLGPGSYVQGDKVLARFVRSRYVSGRGGSSGCSTGTLVFTVTGCGVNQAGATVTVTGPGGFSASGTTNGSGQVTFSVVGYPAGTYSWTVSKGVRFQSQSGTKSVVCATTNTQIVSLSAATGYRCASCCGVPIKENLWLTTPFGTTIAFNFVASQWQGTAVESISCRKDAGCATSSTEDCSFFYSMLGSGCSPVGTSGSGGTGSGGYDITTSPPTMICDAANTCSNRAVQVIVLGNTITCEPFTTTGTARFVYNPSTGVTNDYGTISVTE